MSHFEADPRGYADTEAFEQPRMSGLAIAALVCALLFCIPFLPPIGVILGLIAVVTMVGKDYIRGRGMAIAAIVIGLIFSIAWGITGWFFYSISQQIEAMPGVALTSGSGGDFATFREQFTGDGASADDATVEAFFNEATGRYGAFRSMSIDRGGSPPAGGGAQLVMPFSVVFADQTVPARVEFIILDEKTGAFVRRLSSIELIDPIEGNLRFPPLPAPPTGGPGRIESSSMPAEPSDAEEPPAADPPPIDPDVPAGR